MNYEAIVTTPTQAVLTTEELGFFETAQAMRAVLGVSGGGDQFGEVSIPERQSTVSEVRLQFLRFRRRCNPFG